MKNRIDFLELDKLLAKNTDEGVRECIALARDNPKFDWFKQPLTSKKYLIDAHTRIANYLSSRADFTEFLRLRNLSYMERWQNRGANMKVTSDHVPVVSRVCLHESLSSTPEVSLRVATWNLMNKAHSVASCRDKKAIAKGKPYANTPEQDLDETPDQYIARKIEQFNQIVNILTAHGNNADAMFLQEIDFLVAKPPDQEVKEHLKYEFKNRLIAIGFDLVTTEGLTNAKPQAIIYNTSSLQLDIRTPLHSTISGKSVGGDDPRNTIFEAKFIDLHSRKSVVLASAHLDFDGDYSTKLRDYSAQKAADGSMLIWGGDTNHAPGHNIQGLTGDYNHATNYALSDDGYYTSQHIESTKSKTYDGFGYCPPPGYLVQSTEEPGMRFNVDRNSGRLSIENYTPYHPQSHSLIGFPWMARQSLVLNVLSYKKQIIIAFENKIANEETPAWKQEIINGLYKAKTFNEIEFLLIKSQQYSAIAASRPLEILAFARNLKDDDNAISYELKASGELTIPTVSGSRISLDNGDIIPTRAVSNLSSLNSILSWPSVFSKYHSYAIRSIYNQPLFKGEILQDGCGKFKVQGLWDRQKVTDVSVHTIRDLGWTEINLMTHGEYAIPTEFIDPLINAMKNLTTDTLNITVNGTPLDLKTKHQEIISPPDERSNYSSFGP